jgi:nitrate reductase NapE component
MVFFNLFAMNKLRLSRASNKWVFYLFMIFLNFPVLGYNAVTGFYFKLLAFQILGMGISKMGYLGTAASIGFPVAAIFVLLGLRFGWVRMEE